MSAWRFAAWALAIASTGCAGTQEPGISPETKGNQAFARIQVYEAQIAAADRRAAAPACAERCAGTDDSCVASDGLCALAHELADADALTRCAHAEARCQALRTQTSSCCPATAK